MSDQDDKQELATLRHVNVELGRSIERCRVLLKDCKDKLAANSNDVAADATEASQLSD